MTKKHEWLALSGQPEEWADPDYDNTDDDIPLIDYAAMRAWEREMEDQDIDLWEEWWGS